MFLPSGIFYFKFCTVLITKLMFKYWQFIRFNSIPWSCLLYLWDTLSIEVRLSEWSMLLYGCILLSPTSQINYVNMQHDYVHKLKRLIFVKMPHNYVYMRIHFIACRGQRFTSYQDNTVSTSERLLKSWGRHNQNNVFSREGILLE